MPYLKPTLLLVAAALVSFARPAPPLYKNPKAPVADRVRDLLGRMPLEEKVMQMVCISYERKDTLFTKERRLDERRIRRAYPLGLGQVAVASKIQNVELDAADNARVANELLNFYSLASKAQKDKNGGRLICTRGVKQKRDIGGFGHSEAGSECHSKGK